MSNLNSVIKNLIKINLAAGLLSLVTLSIIRQQQAQQIYNSQALPYDVQKYHSSVKQNAREETSSNYLSSLKLAKKVEKLEGELAQTREKVSGLSSNRVQTSKTETSPRINIASLLPTELSISPEYRISRADEEEKLPLRENRKNTSVENKEKLVTSSQAKANPNAPVTKPENLDTATGSQVLKNQEIAQANHLEQQKLGLSKPQTIQTKTNSNLSNDLNIQNQRVTPLPIQPLASNENSVIISLTRGNSSVTSSQLAHRDREKSLTLEENIAAEARLLYGDSQITLSSFNVTHSRPLTQGEANPSIRLANDIAYGLIIAGEKGHINYGTNTYRRVQTAIRVLRRGEKLQDAARMAEVPSELLQQLIRWGENRPGSLAAMIEPNPDNMNLR